MAVSAGPAKPSAYKDRGPYGPRSGIATRGSVTYSKSTRRSDEPRTFTALPCVSVNEVPVNVVILNGICIPGVLPAPGAGAVGAAVFTTRVTVTVVLAVFQAQVTLAVAQSSVSTVPSWSCAVSLPTSSVSVIVSLQAKVNASPASVKSLVPTFADMRASTIVGGVKSAAPLTKLMLDGLARSFPATSWSSFASGVSVTL